MGSPDNQTEVARVLVTSALLVVFVLGIDPLIFWLAVPWSGLGFWQVYLIWLSVVSLGVTALILCYLLRDEDKSQPQPTPIRRVGRIV